jgi:LuxR family maltose regulon positive regulatory protein
MDTPLLSTKLYTPPPRPNLVPRPRLIEHLNEGLQPGRKLILVSAPAGFGKTTLLSAWCRRAARPVAWVSLDEGDNDPARFWSYVIAALQTVHPALGEGALATLQSPQLPPLQALLTGLINDIAEIPAGAILVLDDFHAITTPQISDSIAFLADNMPSQMRLLLSGRADPLWPLARLRARGELTELRANDLRFTPSEVTTFLNTTMELGLSTEEIAALDGRTEGWIAGLQMAALAMRSQDASAFVRAFGSSHRFILDYLVEEVLDRQPVGTQDFLLATSVLERMSAPLCDAVTGRDDSRSILAQLEQANLFLIPLGDERRWYRYHHLFAELLRSRLGQIWPERVSGLHRRASEWHAQNDLVPEAVRHALAARDVEPAARLIAENALALIYHGELATVIGWLEALPGEMVRSQARLGVATAWAQVYAGQLDAVEALLQDAERALANRGESEQSRHVAGHIAAIRAAVADFRGESSRAIDLARTALESLAQDDLIIRGFTLSLLGTALRDSGDLAAAARASAEAVAVSRAAGDVRVSVTALCELAILHIWQGRLRKATATLHDALRLADQLVGRSGRRPPVAGLVYARLSGVLRAQNDLQGALRYARQAIELCERWGQADISIVGYSSLANILQASGDADGALNAVRKVRQTAAGLSPWYGAVAAAWEARLQLAQGDVSAAVRWAESSGLSGDDAFTLDTESEYRTLARVLIAQGRLNEALDLLGRLLQAAEAAEAVSQVIEVLVLQAKALQAQRRDAAAVAALERALALAEPEGHVRVFVDEGPQMEQLLRQAVSRGTALEFVGTLLSALRAPTDVPEDGTIPTQPLVEPLSQRELEVLHLLVTGASNKDIAHTLFIAVGTVKQHLKSIYGKLDVHSRTEAVHRARELGLL